MKMEEALQTIINSALLTCENHETDDSFISCETQEIERNMKYYSLTPAGITWNLPFSEYKSRQIAFAFYKNEEIYWCHMPENCWRMLLINYYGLEKANALVKEIKGI